MIERAKWRLLSVSLPIALLLVACGGDSGTGSSPTPAPTPTPTPIAKSATATVKGASKTVLVDATSGLTLYIFMPDTSTKSACSAACAVNWPPLMIATGQPTSPIAGKWTVLDRTDPVGRQVLFNGHPLYTYIQDKAPGDAKGEGVNQGKWTVATPDTPQASA